MPNWIEPHEFVEDVADTRVCSCGVPALVHDTVVRDRSLEPIQDGGSPVPEYLKPHIQRIIDAGP